MKNKRKLLRLAVVVAAMALNALLMTGCGNVEDDDDGDDGNNGSGKYWLRTRQTTFALGGTGSPNTTYNDWITYSYENETKYEEKYTTDSTYYHYTREGQTSESTTEALADDDYFRSTTNTTYDSASGLTLKSTTWGTRNSNSFDSEISYSVMLLSDTDGVKTYRQYVIGSIYNDISQDISTQGYSEYKIQKGRTLERKDFSHDGMLISITTYTLSDNAVILAKLRNYTLYNTQSSTYNAYNTVEVISDSDSALVIQERTFVNNTLSYQTESLYEKVNFGSSSGFTYAETNNVIITGYKRSGGGGNTGGNMSPDLGGAGNVTIPAQINGKPVTSIGYEAFVYSSQITGITIPNSVTSIGFGAFNGCTSLDSVTIGDNVTTIGDYAFAGCTSLDSITIGNNVTTIGANAFSSCTSLDSVTIPNKVTSIGMAAFNGCTNLTSVEFKTADTTTIGDNSFPGDLQAKYLASDGGPGTYTRASSGTEWTKVVGSG